MIYLDTSVVLAELLAEDWKAPPSIWSGPLFSSRLLEYELWNRIHARKLQGSHSEAALDLLGRVTFVELTRDTLARALDPFPVAVRTLHTLHLASLLFLREQRLNVELATLDVRMKEAAVALEIPAAF